jgi:hypothetical protein
VVIPQPPVRWLPSSITHHSTIQSQGNDGGDSPRGTTHYQHYAPPVYQLAPERRGDDPADIARAAYLAPDSPSGRVSHNNTAEGEALASRDEYTPSRDRSGMCASLAVQPSQLLGVSRTWTDAASSAWLFSIALMPTPRNLITFDRLQLNQLFKWDI